MKIRRLYWRKSLRLNRQKELNLKKKRNSIARETRSLKKRPNTLGLLSKLKYDKKLLDGLFVDKS